MSILQFAILGAVATSDPNITITRRADGFVATIKPFAVAEQGAVDAEVDRRAGELCAGKSVKWGRFGSVAGIDRRSDKAPEITNYFKEFTCISLQPRAHAAVSADWKPSLADESDVRRFFDLYYAKRDSGDFSAAAAMFDPAQGIVLGSDEQDPLQIATQGYGVGNFYLVNGDTERAKAIFRRVVAGSQWAAFGFIASEADLARMK